MRNTSTAGIGLTVLLLLIGAGFFGCAEDESTIAVRVCGDFAIPANLDAMRIHLLDGDREIQHQTVVSLLRCPEDEIRPLPHTHTFRNVDPEIELVEVVGLENDISVVRTERRIDTRGTFDITISEACRGFQCQLGQSCIAGECRYTPTGPSSTCLESTTAARDAGFDDDAATAGDAGDETNDDSDSPRYCPPSEGS